MHNNCQVGRNILRYCDPAEFHVIFDLLISEYYNICLSEYFYNLFFLTFIIHRFKIQAVSTICNFFFKFFSYQIPNVYENFISPKCKIHITQTISPMSCRNMKIHVLIYSIWYWYWFYSHLTAVNCIQFNLYANKFIITYVQKLNATCVKTNESF